MMSSSTSSIFDTSCDVRNPSKKCRKGIRLSSVAACAISAKSIASCTLAELSMAKPVVRASMTSLWSPKIDSACVASVRAVMWNTVGVSSPAIFNMLGTLSSKPCDAVNVQVSAPVCSAPCTAPAAPPSLCISTTEGMVPQRFLTPSEAHWSHHSPMFEEGVMG